MNLTWNLITKNLHPHQQLGDKIAEKVAKLEEHLVHFADDAASLTVTIEHRPQRAHFTATLNLHLPSNVLHSAKSAPDPITAFDLAVRTLLREVASLKAEFRREDRWRPATSPLGLHTGKFAPVD